MEFKTIQDIFDCDQMDLKGKGIETQIKNIIVDQKHSAKTYTKLLSTTKLLNYLYNWAELDVEKQILTHCIKHGTDKVIDLIMFNLDDQLYGDVLIAGLHKCPFNKLSTYVEWLLSETNEPDLLSESLYPNIFRYISEKNPEILSKFIFHKNVKIRETCIYFIKKSG